MRAKTIATILAAMILAAVLHGLTWMLSHETVAPPGVGAVQSLSFSPFTRDQNPVSGHTVTQEQIAADVATAAQWAKGIRTYAVTGGLELVPLETVKIPRFRLTLGAWIDREEARTRTEIETAIKIANANRSVVTVMVGNETLLREDRTPEEMIGFVREVRRRVKANTRVTTAEPWHVWAKYPELAAAVDFISVHILPYWEEIPAEQAVAHTFARYDELKKLYPNKKIVIAEFGWPSQGYNRKDAVPDPLKQAEVIRSFIAEATRRGVEYNIVEAFDQPWKGSEEGSVGSYWGIFDAERKLKFSLDGLVTTPDTGLRAGVALIAGALLTLVGLARRRPTFGHAAAYALAANAMTAGLVSAAWWPFEAYMNFGTWIIFGVAIVALLPLTAITLAKIHEIAEVVLGRRPERLLHPNRQALVDRPPMVSIQIPAYKEQPEMLKQTLDAIAALDYPNFEALVIINNCDETLYGKPIEEHCQRLGPRFKYVYLPKVGGFKAGALNKAMEQCDPQAEILALIDADYVVDRAWLADLVPAFADPTVALVQAPQDHRDGADSLLKRMMNWEYAGFFDIGMIQRNEDDAIVAHGTMLLIRRSAFEQVGAWQSDTIVEDTELGLRLFEAGYSAQYTNTRYGWGILPDTFKAFKVQRHRWAYGAVQIIKKHWRHMMPGRSTLTSAQKFHYTTGWFYWLSDALGVLMAILNLIWVPVVILADMMVPTVPMTVPILTAFAVNVAHCLLLYRQRVRSRFSDTLLAAVAAMSLQLTVARAVFDGLVRDGLPFMRTDKGGAAGARARTESVAGWETTLGLLLLAAALALHLGNQEEVVEITFFAATLAIQAMPFLAACVVRGVELLGARAASGQGAG